MRSRSVPGLVAGLALLAALTGCYRFESLRTASVCSAEAAREAATADAARADEARKDFGGQCGSSRKYVNRVYRETYESLRGGPSAASAIAGARTRDETPQPSPEEAPEETPDETLDESEEPNE